VTTNPVEAIKERCHRQVKRFLKDFPPCATLDELLAVWAQRLGTAFHEIHSDDDLVQLTKQYAAGNEPVAALFATKTSGSQRVR
jgi:hypothetical protein